MRGGGFDTTLITLAGFVGLFGPLKGAGQHAISVPLIIGSGQISLERFDQLGFFTGLFILFRQPEHNHRIPGIAGEHLFKDFDS